MQRCKPMPIAQRKGNRVIIRTYDMATQKLLTEREYDFRDSGARDVVSRHLIHCINNGKGCQIFNVRDEK